MGALLALVAASGCAAHLGATAPTCGAQAVTAAAAGASSYLAITTPANHRLDTDFDRFDGPDHADLAAARADLRDIAVTERAFDHDLARLALPAAAASWAHTLASTNEARAQLTSRAANSTSLARLNDLRPALTSANAPVERAVTALRADLGLPPPDTH
ncbi:hypothetical protein [Streptacidiphilus anmyonensis]|uniref:hypothetical protein n=1 Tax=Streptacidiphilus anmyonensis TaxID=405782 RepID=UPI0005AA55DF|nr:hypothetical protein [Streptacidiphilus anmyonensis]